MVERVLFVLFDRELPVISAAVVDMFRLTHHNSSKADGLSREPTQALEGKHGIDIVRESFALMARQRQCSFGAMIDNLTMTNLPERLVQVTSGGAAMTEGCIQYGISLTERGRLYIPDRQSSRLQSCRRRREKREERREKGENEFSFYIR